MLWINISRTRGNGGIGGPGAVARDLTEPLRGGALHLLRRLEGRRQAVHGGCMWLTGLKSGPGSNVVNFKKEEKESIKMAGNLAF